MQYFIVTDNDTSIAYSYEPCKVFTIPLDDNSPSERIFVEMLDAFVSMYDDDNIIISTTHDHSNIRTIFDYANQREIDGMCTIFYTNQDDTDFLDATKVDRIIVCTE